MNWGILGPGSIAEKFAAAIQQENESIYGVASRKLEKAEDFASRHGVIHAYGSYEELLSDEQVDIVYLATPHSNHYEYMIDCLQHGKHVLCEKAITVNSRQLREIKELAQHRDLVVAEAMTIYHMPLYEKLKEFIASGELGPLHMIQVSFGSVKEKDGSNRFFNEDLAGGALFDIGSYALSFTRYFLSSQPNDIQTTVKKYNTGVDDQSGIILQNKEGEMAVISLSFSAKFPKRGVLAFEKGYITVDDFPRASQAVAQYLDGATKTISTGDTDKGLTYEVSAMNRYVSSGEQADTLSLSMDVIEIMDNVRKQWQLRYPFPFE
ncbi:Gfo/Idh/MocA family protein [Salibacterium aidingense]|uniref:Gfo/Idh/MocA family protein n=1 Tax=Salibacterium aidingense TaxID=384933 RepID=UPI0003FC890E|nr:Gfo/Idh/MocA family oxidoreductase [Salibacterium aidingense]